MRRSIEFISELIFILILFVVLFSYAMFQGGFVSWFLFYAFLPFLLYMVGLSFYPIKNWKIDRKLSKRGVTAGDSVEIEVTLTRRFPFPIYYCVIEEYLPDSLEVWDFHLEKFRRMNASQQLDNDQKRQIKRVAFPWFRRFIRYRYELSKVPRGEHHLKELRVKTGDFFGFVKKEHIYVMDQKLLVFPRRRPVRLQDRMHSFEQGGSPSSELIKKNTNVVTGIREYVPGDRFAWVDWKTTAKKNEMMTKEFEQEKSADMLMILNGVYDPSTLPLSFEGAVEFSVSLLEELRMNSSQLAFISLGEYRHYFRLQSADVYRQKVQRHLAQIRPHGRIPFSHQLERELPQIASGVVTMVVSHYLDVDIQRALVKLEHKSKKVILFYVRPHSRANLQEQQWMQNLKQHGILVQVLSEEDLTQEEFEVNT